MATEEMNFKSFHDVKQYLSDNADKETAPPKPGAFMLFSFPPAPKNDFDLVFEGIYLGKKAPALDIAALKSMGVTHLVNASMGKKFNQTDTDAEFYQEGGIAFHGIPALDIMTYKILPHLKPAAAFMHQALQGNGKVYVHCQQGVSRSATVVLAYLMLHRGMTLMEAARAVRPKREVFPNEGFLKQLASLERQIKTQTSAGAV